MIRRRWCWPAVAGLALALSLVVAGTCIAADFTADQVTTFGKESLTGKIYVSGSTFRSETTMNGTKHVMIVDAKKNHTYLLDLKGKSYLETPKAMPNPMQAIEKDLAKQCTVKKLGTQAVSGTTCDKSLYTPKVKQQGAPESITVWTSKKLKWPVKVEFIGGNGKNATMLLKNIKMGKPSASLFEVPKGFKKIQPPKPTGKAPMAPAKK